MQRRIPGFCGVVLMAMIGTHAWCAELGAEPARTRPEMKRRIEALKYRESRIPLPELTPEQIAAGQRSANNGRLRSIYLPESWQASRGPAANPPGERPAEAQSRKRALGDNQSCPAYAFRKRLFWIVCRTNDCQYCLGHQELALRRVGMTDDQIGSLDCDWSIFPPEEQAAMRVTRKITLTPHLVTEEDIESLRKYYSDEQIVDIIQTVAGNNSTNRWTGSTGIPQDRSSSPEEPRKLDTPTSPAFSEVETKVAPFDHKLRPAWEPRAEAEQAMNACRTRTAAVKLPAIEAARAALASDTPGITPPVWVQALSYFPESALRAWKHRQAVARDGKLAPILKAQIAWVCARENRAWYSAAHARARLNALGVSDDTLFSIGADEEAFLPPERATFAFARKLTSAPHTVVDEDVFGLKKLFSNSEVAEIIFLVCDANAFDRITETLKLPLEGGDRAVAIASVGDSTAASTDDSPRPVPLTRPEMKRLIEDVKVRKPRIPLPELTDKERQTLGEQADSYESILRLRYTPWVEVRRGPRPARGTGPARDQDPAMTLDYAFKTQLFWIVSRTNNCQYCMGHQESKLLTAGLSEDQIASLDGDWSTHSDKERAAFAFARKITFQPHEFSDADIASLREHFTELQILEMVMSVSGNNVSNRWKEGIGVPQRKDEGGYARSEDSSLPRGSYLTPTSEKFQARITKVAPLFLDSATGEPTRTTVCRRPALEPRARVEEALAACRNRTPRLPLVDEPKARALLSDSAPAGPLPQWMRLLANFPRDGVRQVATIRDSDEKGELSPLLKAQLSWIIARQDRAWYAAGQARNRLREQGQTDDQIFALDGDWKGFSPGDRALFVVAKKLAASPVVLTDRDVAQAVELAGPRDVVQTISYTTSRAYFDRLTEAAGLTLED